MADKTLEQIKKLLASLSPEQQAELLGDNTSSKPARQSNFQTGKRPNTFENSPHFNKHKSDSKTDKLLWGENSPEERVPTVKVKSTCKICNKKEEINANFAYKDEDTKELVHTCDLCIKNKKK